MAKLKVKNVFEHHGADMVEKKVFVYRGWYAYIGWRCMYHAKRGVREGVNISNVTTDDVCNFGERIRSEVEFINHVDEYCEYLQRAHGSLSRAYRISSTGDYV